jgi:hypothetical protein
LALTAWHSNAAESAGQSPSAPISFALLMLLLGGLAAAAGFWTYQRYFATEAAARPEDPFSERLITQTFISALPSLTRELNLEVARTWQMETLERSDTKRVCGINFGTNVAQIRMPVTYTTLAAPALISTINWLRERCP